MREMDASTKLKATGLAPVVAAPSSPSGGDFSDSRAAQDAERALRYRLVIEKGAGSGAYIYKTLDRVTGEVVRQLPREDVVKLRQDTGYRAGGVINTSA
jgi:flagellar protein FlaG